MVQPVETIKGIGLEEVRERVDQRPLYVWGTNDRALEISTILRRYGLQIKGFIDEWPDLPSWPEIKPRLSPEILVDQCFNPFVIVATSSMRYKVVNYLERHGMHRGKDFLTYLDITHLRAVLEISSKGWMWLPLEDKEFTKEVNEDKEKSQNSKTAFEVAMASLPKIKEIGMIEIGWQYDPLANPYILSLCSMLRSTAPLHVVTRLAGDFETLRILVEIKPAIVSVIVIGAGDWFLPTVGLNWHYFTDRLHFLAQQMTDHSPATRIRLRYHPLKNEPFENINIIESLSHRLGISVELDVLYPFPYDKLLEYIENKAPMPEAWFKVPWEIDFWLGLAKAQKDKPCLCKRFFPLIYHNGSFLLCHLYSSQALTKNEHSIEWDKLLSLRRCHPHCALCQSQGLHRLDLSVIRP